MNVKEEKQDVFAKIAGQRHDFQKANLIEIQPEKINPRLLPANSSNSSAVFKPMKKISTQAELQVELARQRKIYAPFLKNLAPKIISTRTQLDLKKINWRLETKQDQKDLLSVLDGKGEWEAVTIPHFGGPLGRAVSYYRTTFDVSKKMLEQGAIFIVFRGVDYKAHVFLNGSFLGSHEGFFAPFEFDATQVVRQVKNVLVVKLENDAVCMSNDSWGDDGHLYDGDKIYAATGPGYDDPQIGWHHCPPGMGIYQAVYVEARQKIFISDIFVRPLLDEKRAEAWIEVTSTYLLRRDINVNLSVFGQNFAKTLFKNKEFPVPAYVGPTVNYYRFAFDIPNPKIWDLETPWLYQIQVQIADKETGEKDIQSRQFGMRSFRFDETGKPKGMYELNGRKIRLRGANTMGFEQQDVMKGDFKQLVDDILLAKICHMNFWRLTQRPVQDEVYEYCDRLGLMTQTDLPLFGVLRRNQFAEAVRQAGEMEKLVRNHPCNVVDTYINEPFPNAQGKGHRQLLRHELESFFVAASEVVRLNNPDRVIKPVDGDYDPPAPTGLPDNHCYTCWYNGHGVALGKLNKGYWQWVRSGWNYGCGEFGAEGLDPVKTMMKYYPKDWLPKSLRDEWFPDKIVQAQTPRFHYMWFSTQKTLPEWVQESQEFQAWATRFMTEAFRRDNRMVSFAIHLFIDSFPSGWMKTIMDCDRNPKPAYFAYRESLSPILANIRMDRQTYFSGEKTDLEFWICNDTNDTLKNGVLHYQIRSLVDGKILFAQKVKATVPAFRSTYQGTLAWRLPKVEKRTKLTIEMAVEGARGKIIHSASQSIEVFPRETILSREIYVLGSKESSAWKLALELGLTPIAWTKGKVGIIVASDLDTVLKQKASLESAVKAGARLVLTDLILKEDLLDRKISLAGTEMKFYHTGMGTFYFANPWTGHPLTEDFCDKDFFLWYHAGTGLIEPILPYVMITENMEKILSSGRGQWGNAPWLSCHAAGLKKFGQGEMIVSLINLHQFVLTNPVARKYAKRLFEI
jgi:hypothetical protein